MAEDDLFPSWRMWDELCAGGRFFSGGVRVIHYLRVVDILYMVDSLWEVNSWCLVDYFQLLHPFRVRLFFERLYLVAAQGGVTGDRAAEEQQRRRPALSTPPRVGTRCLA